ncbi:MAG: Na-translocating system protein MpsC family protein [Phycisphaerae bacterium]|nr:Na-translocating system protein MpsC family protein [Phycisphaerae bacterium]
MKLDSPEDKETLMRKNRQSELQIAEATSAFAKSHMPVTPDLVSVGIHPHCVITALRGIVAPAEKNYAEKEKSCRLMEEFYDNIYNAEKKLLEVAVENILGRMIESSILWVEPKSGDGVIMFTFAR